MPGAAGRRVPLTITHPTIAGTTGARTAASRAASDHAASATNRCEDCRPDPGRLDPRRPLRGRRVPAPHAAADALIAGRLPTLQPGEVSG